jgi:predicted nucleotidyltransferase
VEWSDSPKMEVLLNDMPDFVAIAFDEWLDRIEAEENAKEVNDE